LALINLVLAGHFPVLLLVGLFVNSLQICSCVVRTAAVLRQGINCRWHIQLVLPSVGKRICGDNLFRRWL